MPAEPEQRRASQRRPRRGSGERRVRVPQQARSRRTREAVLAAAVHSFERRGYDETTTAQIAAKAGIAVGTLYGYFRDKREILLEVVDGTISQIAELVVAELDPEQLASRDPREIVRGLIDAVFHSQALQPGIQRVMWERYFKDEEFRAPLDGIRDRMRAAIDRFADALDARGLLRAVDRDRAALVVLHAVQWNATQAFLTATPAEIDATARAVSDLVARYLFPDAD